MWRRNERRLGKNIGANWRGSKAVNKMCCKNTKKFATFLTLFQALIISVGIGFMIILKLHHIRWAGSRPMSDSTGQKSFELYAECNAGARAIMEIVVITVAMAFVGRGMC